MVKIYLDPPMEMIKVWCVWCIFLWAIFSGGIYIYIYCVYSAWAGQTHINKTTSSPNLGRCVHWLPMDTPKSVPCLTQNLSSPGVGRPPGVQEVYHWLAGMRRDFSELITGWWFGTCFIFTLGISSSQLTNSYFSEGLKPPTRSIFNRWLCTNSFKNLTDLVDENSVARWFMARMLLIHCGGPGFCLQPLYFLRSWMFMRYQVR